MNVPGSKWLTRREVLVRGAATVALPLLMPAGALGREGTPPSETVRIGGDRLRRPGGFRP